MLHYYPCASGFFIVMLMGLNTEYISEEETLWGGVGVGGGGGGDDYLSCSALINIRDISSAVCVGLRCNAYATVSPPPTAILI